MPPNVRTQAKTAAASSNNYLAGSSSNSAVVVMPPQQMTPDAAYGCGDGVGYAAAGVSCASSAPMASLGAPQAGLMTGVGAAASLAHLSFMPGRASRCCFGDTEHHVDAPRSPIKGHVPLQTTGTRAGQPCAYGHWGAAPPHDPNRLFGASPVNRLQPATLHAAELLAPGMVPPPTLPQTPLDPSSPIARRGTVAPRGVELPFVAEGAPQIQPELAQNGRFSGILRREPLRSVGRFSTAIDPSKLSAWQYQTLQRTRPEAPLAKRAIAYQATKPLGRAYTEASLRRQFAEMQQQQQQPGDAAGTALTSQNGWAEMPSGRRQPPKSIGAAASAAAVCDATIPTATGSSRGGVDAAPAGRGMNGGGAGGGAFPPDSPYGLGAQFPFGPSGPGTPYDFPATGLAASASEPTLGGQGGGGKGSGSTCGHVGTTAAPRPADTFGAVATRRPAAQTREEAAALLEEAEEFIQFAEAALVHVSPAVGAKSRLRQRQRSALPLATAKETGGAGLPGSTLRPRASRPMHETGEQARVVEDPFPGQLMTQLQQVPGANLQILRLMRRGDWRVKG